MLPTEIPLTYMERLTPPQKDWYPFERDLRDRGAGAYGGDWNDYAHTPPWLEGKPNRDRAEPSSGSGVPGTQPLSPLLIPVNWLERRL